MVPKGWENVLLGEIFDFRNGINADKSQYGQGVKFVNVMDVFGNDVLTEPKIIGRVSISDKKLNDNRLEYGDVLFNRTSETFNEIAMSAVYLDNADATFGGFVIRGRPLTKNLEPKYTVYAFQDSNFRKQVIKLGQGAVRANIGQKDLVKVELLVPPLTEQQKIAKILSTWDKAISTTVRLIENSTQQKKALMQQLLTGKKRLLDDKGQRFEGEWQEVKLGDISQITTGSSNRVDSSLEAEYAFFDRSMDIRTSSIYLFDSEAVIVAGEGQEFIPKHFIGKFDLHQRTYAIMDFKDSNGKFLYYYITFYRHYFLAQAVGSTVKSLRLPMFKKMPINLPSLKEQQKIAAVLTNADKEIELLKQQLSDLQQEKKALMQVLLTGKKRVRVDGEG